VIALLLGLLGFAWAYFTRQPVTNDARSTRTSILPPEKSNFNQIAVSPDGRNLAFTAATGDKIQLWARALDSTEPRMLAGTQGARFPFWSPDSRFIGFFADGWLKKIEVTAGLVQPLCVASLPLGGAWSRDGVILFGAGGGLWRISATGGETTRVTTLDRSRDENVHRTPTFLPDGHYFLYSIVSGQKETIGVYLGSLDDKTFKRQLLNHITVIKYVSAVPGDSVGGAGWLVFGQDNALLARPFDTRRLDFTGEPVKLSEKVGSDFYPTNYFTFSVSDNGVLVFDPSLNRERRQYRWVNRRGQLINALDTPAGSFTHSLSYDEKRFIADRSDPKIGTYDLWLYEASEGNGQLFTLDPASDISPVWSPNGSGIVWSSTRGGGVGNLYQKSASFAGVDTLLLKSDYHKLSTDWSRDRNFIIYSESRPNTKWDVWVLQMTGNDKDKKWPVVDTKDNDTSGTLSPDGQWLAYASDELGQFEIYVQSFPGGGGKQKVSNGGGSGPRWRRNGRELFYYSADGHLMAAQVKGGEVFKADTPAPLFPFRAGTVRSTSAPTPYAVTDDGQRFLINAVVETEPNAPLTVVTNWTAEVKK
jgi:eukaryotic-like serine/threonine-protein kinase